MGRREFFGVKISPKIKRDFLERIQKEGLSTCQIIEALMVAWVEGGKALPATGFNQSKTIVINQSFQRFVKRGSRRDYSEFKPEPNYYDGTYGFWIYRADEPLNEHGHVVDCQCSVCRPFIRKMGRV